MKIRGVCRPVPSEYAKRIYEGKTVFVAKRCLCRVSKGDKFVIYESHGPKAYTGWADIENIGMMNVNSMIRKYKSKLMVTKEELKEYAKHHKEMSFIEFKNLEKFKNPIKPEKFVTVAGKYIYEDEFEKIKSKKG